MIYECAKFNSCRQEPDEPVEAFITALYALAEHCGFETLHDVMIRDRIVVGIQDCKLSEKLQLHPTLTLEKAITTVRQAEDIKKQQSVIRGDSKEETLLAECPVQAIHDTTTTTMTKSQCASCRWRGKFPALERRKCPAKSATCRRCQKRGHFQSVCHAAPHAHLVHLEHKEQSEFLGAIASQDTSSSWSVTLLLNRVPTELLIDTGAEVTVISEHTHTTIGSPLLLPPLRSLKGPSNYSLPVKGYFQGTLNLAGKETSQDIYVVKRLHQQLLGAQP